MSGATIDYELRPAKNVDRRVFIDLLSRTERWETLQDATYISMGGYPMTDHRMVHRRLGIENLVSIDGDQEVVKRQVFNKPTEKCVCIPMLSGEFIENLDEALKDAGVPLETRKIVWLDYTKPNTLAEQLNEFEALLNKLGEHDIVRITLNANNEALRYEASDDMDAEQIRDARFSALEDMIGNYMPHGASAKDLSKLYFPILLAKVLGRTAEEAFPPTDKYTFFPLSTISYKDGQRMLTMTGIILKNTRTKAFIDEVDLKRWAFYSNAYHDVKTINVAVLTLKERMLMERLAVSSEIEDVSSHLGFEKFGPLTAAEYFEDFKEHARFYPSHAQIDL